jgi:hypothetical protein
MPRTDREDSRKLLRQELTGCGFSASDAEGWVTTFSDEHLTSADVGSIRMMLFKVQMIFDAKRQALEEDLKSERALRQQFIARIKDFVGQSSNELSNFAAQAEAADKAGVWHSQKHLAILAALDAVTPVRE